MDEVWTSLREIISIILNNNSYNINNMKILLIISSHEMSKDFNKYIVIIKEKLINQFIKENIEIDICLINSNEIDELKNYDDVLKNIKYKFSSKNSKQYEKTCNIMRVININLYDWFIKIRPDLELLEDINLDKIKICDKNCINSRVRWYIGDHINIKNGTSLNIGEDSCWKNSYIYDNNITYIVPDDQILFFHKTIAQKAFKLFNIHDISEHSKKFYMFFDHQQDEPNKKWLVNLISVKQKLLHGYSKQTEWFFKDILDYHGIKVNPIGINVKLRSGKSGDLII